MSDQFTERLPSMLVKGRDGTGEDAYYIPFPTLEEYWTENKVRDVLRKADREAQNVMSGQVIQEFLRVFSILVYIGEPNRISLFTTRGIKDEHLPLPDRPPSWLNNQQEAAVFSKFEQAQWMFCPLEINFPSLHRRQLDPRIILPVTYECKLGNWSDGDPTEIWKVKINGGCSNLSRVIAPDGLDGSDSTILEDLFAVFKTCGTDQDAKEQFDMETTAYANLPEREYGRYREHILAYYGSFSQNGKHTMILEYAESGTLLQFFEQVDPPTRLEQFVTFWKRMSGLLLALHLIHEMDVGEHEILSGIHQDVHPANIFVVPESSGDFYDARFKLGDFGATHMNRLRGSDRDTGQKRYNDGNMNRTYLAPECIPKHGTKIPRRVSPTIDVWALGAVFSDALIWSFLGEDGREVYREERSKEIKSGSLELYKKGYDSCFHNGHDRLKAVSIMHERALENKLAEDEISVKISELILQRMLQRDKSHMQIGRLDPEYLFGEIRDAIELRPSRISASSPSALVQSPSPMYSNENSGHPFPVPLQETPRRGQPASYVRGLGVHTIQEPRTPQRRSLTQSPSPSSAHRTLDADPQRASSRHSTTGGILKSTRSSVRDSYSSVNSDIADGIEQRNPSPENSRNRQNSLLTPHLTPSALPRDNRGANGDSSPSSTGRRPSSAGTRSAGSIVTVGRFYELLQKKSSIHILRSHEFDDESRKLNDALGKVRSMGGRDQIFLIDDAGSMSHHKSKVEQTARVIAYAVKHSDPDGMELYFSSEMNECQKHKKSTGIEDAIRDHSFRSARTTNMAKCLGELLHSIPHRTKPGCAARPVSIYVLTDAVWEEGDPGVDRCIAAEAKRLSKGDLPTSATMIQFIRFGDKSNRQAAERVRYLDDDLVKKFDLGAYDIVDTRHCDGDVSEMLIGSISAANDELSS